MGLHFDAGVDGLIEEILGGEVVRGTACPCCFRDDGTHSVFCPEALQRARKAAAALKPTKAVA